MPGETSTSTTKSQDRKSLIDTSAPSPSKEAFDSSEERYQNMQNVPTVSGSVQRTSLAMRESVYEINLPETPSNPRYTMLNVGNRDTPSTYMPLKIGSSSSTSLDDT